MKTYNIWLILEEIDEENDDNGNDLKTQKLAKFDNEINAEKFYNEQLESAC